MLEFFFFSAFIPAFLTLRIDLDNSGLSDYQNNLLSLTCYGDWDLSNIVYCPDNTWAYGFSLVDSQDYGVLNIVLDCRGQKYDTNTSMWSVTTSQVVQYSNLGIFSGISLRKTDFVYCNGDSGHDFIRGSKVRMWCPSNIDYAQGIVEVKIRCSYYDSITTSLKTTNPAAAYTANYSTCKAGYVACGYEIRYNPYEQTIHFGAIDIRFQCCKICEESQGFYMTAGRICAYCDISCLQCSESATHCTKCPSGFTLNADNTCTTNIVRTLVFSEFFDPFSTDSNLQTTCGPYVLIGGYNVFGKSHWFEKSMTGLAVHNTVEIRVNFYKIGTWPDGSGRIWIDSVLQKTLHATQLERPIYYSSDCGFNNYLQNVFKVVLLLSHDASSISIKFDINSTGDNAFWAINRFQLITYSKCDVTCNDCTGPLFTQCTSCTFPRFLTIANTCEITCNTPYFAYLTTWTCVITCPFPNYGNPIDRTCDEVCPDNYYMNDGDRQCYSVCRNNTYGNPLNGKCDTMCPSEMYKDTTTNLCLLCEYNCATCTSSSTNCESCTFSWLEALPNCENPTYIEKLENNILNNPSLSHADVMDSGWSVINSLTTIDYVTACGSYKLFGGYGLFGTGAQITKTFTSLKAHLNARLTFYFMKIGNWNSNKIKILADSITIANLSFSSTNDSSAYKLCGSSIYSEALRRVDAYFTHIATSLSIIINSDLTLPATQSSWGIFGLTLTIYLCHITCNTCFIADNDTQCLTCAYGLYLQVNPAPSSCLATCPSNKYKHSTDNTCLPCDSSCLTCQAGTSADCLSCSKTYLLFPPGPSTCSASCNLGTYINEASYECSICDPSCKECLAGGVDSCISCNVGNYLQLPPGPSKCLSTCQVLFYPDSSSNLCKNCDVSCKECSDKGSNSCTSCNSGEYLQVMVSPSSCLASCPDGYYRDNYSNSCKNCDPSCSTCFQSNSSSCLSCKLGYYLLSNPPAKCLSVCSNDSYFNSITNRCESCDISCLTCSLGGPFACQTCNPNLKLILQDSTGPAACSLTCPNGSFASYNDNNGNICQKCNDSCLSCSGQGRYLCTGCKDDLFLFIPPGPSSCEKNCSSGYYGDNTTKICKKCDNSCMECKNGEVNGCISCKSGYYLKEDNEILNNTSGKCSINLSNTIVPLLKNSSTSLTYLLVFSSNYSKIYSIYKINTTVSIDGISPSFYKYNITLLNGTDNFLLEFYNVTCQITKYPLMNVYLNPSKEILSKQSIQLSTYNLTNHMQYYYWVDDETISMINETTKAINTLNDITSNSFMANNFFSFGGSFIFQFLISMDIIRFLRYFEVQYPENVLSIFKANLPTSDFIPNLQIDEREEDGNMPNIFEIYGVSIYIFNNNGNNLIEGSSYWLFGLLVFKSVNCFQSVQSKNGKILLIIVSNIFVWSYSMSYFLSTYLELAFYTFLAYRFPTSETDMGRLNWFFSLIFGVLIIIIFPFVSLKIRKLHPKIHPIDLDESQRKNFDSFHNNSSNRQIVKENDSIKFSSTSNRKQIISLILLENKHKENDNLNVNVENIDLPSKKIYERPPKNQLQPQQNLNNKFGKILKRLSISKIKKSEDYPFDWRGSILEKPSKNSPIIKSSPKIKIKRSTPKSCPQSKDDNIEANRYGVLYKDFKQNSFFRSYFILWSLFKQVLYALVIAVAFDKPFIGLILELSITGVYILSMVIINPFNEKIELLQNVFNESCGLSAIGCAFYMAYMDKMGIIDEEFRMKIGWGIVISNLLIIIVFLLRMIVSWTIIFYTLMRKMCIYLKNKWKWKNKVEGEEILEKSEKNYKGTFDNTLKMENF